MSLHVRDVGTRAQVEGALIRPDDIVDEAVAVAAHPAPHAWLAFPVQCNVRLYCVQRCGGKDQGRRLQTFAKQTCCRSTTTARRSSTYSGRRGQTKWNPNTKTVRAELRFAPLSGMPRAGAVVIVPLAVDGFAQTTHVPLHRRVDRNFFCVLVTLHELLEGQASATGSTVGCCRGMG